MSNFFQEHISDILSYVAAAFTGIGGWLLGRKKQKIDYANSVMELYQKALTDLEKRTDEKIAELRTELREWKEKYQSLKSEFEDYKKKH